MQTAVENIASASEEAAAATADDELVEAVRRLRMWRAFLPLLRGELELLNEHYRAWRATKITVRTETHERALTLDTLCRAAPAVSDSGAVTFSDEPKAAGAVAQARGVWEHLGMLVTVDPCGEVKTPKATTRTNKIVVRVPRRVTLSTCH